MKHTHSTDSILKAALCAASGAAAAVFLLGAGIGNVMSHLGSGSKGAVSRPSTAEPIPNIYQNLERYTASLEPTAAVAKAQTSSLLPDVDTMIEKLATRLKESPEDIKGWKMLGWSYFQLARYSEAAAAFDTPCATILALSSSVNFGFSLRYSRVFSRPWPSCASP